MPVNYYVGSVVFAMKKTTFLAGLLAEIMAFSSINGCSCSRQPFQDNSIGTGASSMIAQDRQTGGQQVGGQQTGLTKPVGESSLDKIRIANKEGSITREDAAVLAVRAAYFPENLPARYASEPGASPIFEINGEWNWIAENWDNLSDKTRQSLTPFFVEPDSPESCFNPVNLGKKFNLSALTEKIKILGHVSAEGENAPLIYSTASHKDIISIHYYDPNVPETVNAAMKARAELVLEAFTVAWPMFNNLLNIEPTEHFNTYLVDIQNTELMGEARWQNPPLKYWINLRKTLDGKQLKAVAVHELFHIFQYYYAAYYRTAGIEQEWITESTATWAIHYVYPDYNVEHMFIEEFFENIDGERITNAGHLHYANYLFFLFLTQYTGQASIINTVLDKCKSGGIRDNLPKAISPFESIFSEFALYCWDKDPYEPFQDVPSFPHKGAGANACTNTILAERLEIKESEVLSPGGCNYRIYDFSDDINKVVFDFSETEKNKNIRSEVLLKINNVWTREDWSELEEREFCRSRPSEKVNTVIIAWGNADLSNAYSVDYKVDTRGTCEENVNFTNITAEVSMPPYNMSMRYVSEEILVFDRKREYAAKDEDAEEGDSEAYGNTELYVVKNRSAKYDQKVSGQFSTFTAAGILNETYEKGKSPVKIEINHRDKTGYILLNPTVNDNEWVTYTMTSAFGTDVHKNDIEALGFPNKIELTENDFTSEGIKGKRDLETLVPGFSSPVKLVLAFNYNLWD